MPCADCEGFYALEYDEHGGATAYHSEPYCPAFVAITTSIDAIEHYEKCRAKKKTP